MFANRALTSLSVWVLVFFAENNKKKVIEISRALKSWLGGFSERQNLK